MNSDSKTTIAAVIGKDGIVCVADSRSMCNGDYFFPLKLYVADDLSIKSFKVADHLMVAGSGNNWGVACSKSIIEEQLKKCPNSEMIDILSMLKIVTPIINAKYHGLTSTTNDPEFQLLLSGRFEHFEIGVFDSSIKRFWITKDCGDPVAIGCGARSAVAYLNGFYGENNRNILNDDSLDKIMGVLRKGVLVANVFSPYSGPYMYGSKLDSEESRINCKKFHSLDEIDIPNFLSTVKDKILTPENENWLNNKLPWTLVVEQESIFVTSDD